MKVKDIYKKYKINKGLQEHMLRVAAVAQQICDSYKKSVDTETIIKACLLHDLGNLIKFDLDKSTELLEPQGIEFWTQAKAEMIDKYGNDVYVATSKMVTEIAPGTTVEKTVNEMSFDEIKTVSKGGSDVVKISLYADMRVGLHGVVITG